MAASGHPGSHVPEVRGGGARSLAQKRSRLSTPLQYGYTHAMSKAETKAVVEKAQALLRLAIDNPESDESRNAAVKVVQMMKEHDLVLMPKAEVEAIAKVVSGANELAQRVEKEKMQNILLGGALGFFLGGGKLGK